jgi:hypothetical protein
MAFASIVGAAGVSVVCAEHAVNRILITTSRMSPATVFFFDIFFLQIMMASSDPGNTGGHS